MVRKYSKSEITVATCTTTKGCTSNRLERKTAYSHGIVKNLLHKCREVYPL